MSKKLKNLYLLLSCRGITEFDIYLDENYDEAFITTQNENRCENLEQIDKFITKYFPGNNKKLTKNIKIKIAEIIFCILNIKSIESVIDSININMESERMSIIFIDRKIFSFNFENCEGMKIITMILSNYY